MFLHRAVLEAVQSTGKTCCIDSFSELRTHLQQLSPELDITYMEAEFQVSRFI